LPITGCKVYRRLSLLYHHLADKPSGCEDYYMEAMVNCLC